MWRWGGKMLEECYKCGYKSPKNKEIFGKFLCEFCAHFAPEKKEDFDIYSEEKVDGKELQTFRKQGKMGGIKQKRGMKAKAIQGKIMSRAPFGYEIKNNKLVPAVNADLVEKIYEEFLNTDLSLNQLSKKYLLSLNGLKKVLTNFTYIGKIKFDGEVHDGKHKPLVSSTLFNHVQDKLEKLKIKK